jgi:hypothetical protein
MTGSPLTTFPRASRRWPMREPALQTSRGPHYRSIRTPLCPSCPPKRGVVMHEAACHRGLVRDGARPMCSIEEMAQIRAVPSTKAIEGSGLSRRHASWRLRWPSRAVRGRRGRGSRAKTPPSPSSNRQRKIAAPDGPSSKYSLECAKRQIPEGVSILESKGCTCRAVGIRYLALLVCSNRPAAF